VGQDAVATLTPAHGAPPEVERKAEAVRDARDRLGDDVDLMAGELRAAIGVTLEKLLRKAAVAMAVTIAWALLRRALGWAWRRMHQTGGATRGRRTRAAGRVPTARHAARAARTARRH
jgi:hypothetical protein